MVNDVTDDDLMMLYRDGDADAFDVLFDRHHGAVYNFAWTLLHDGHLAADVLQESFLVVARKAADYQPRGHFRTWLLRVCRNRCLNMIDTNRRRQKLTAESGLELVASGPPIPAPDVQVLRDERAARIQAGINALPERQKEAIALYAYEDLTYKEIAEILETPVNTVKTLIHRARQTLASALRDTVNGESLG